MRWLRGGSLWQAIANGPLELDTVVRHVSQVALALHAAHRQGVVHGDVKPSNVLLDDEGNAYLSDFGIAVDRVRASSSPSTSPRDRNRPPTVDGDLHALGVLLHEALTGSGVPRSGPSPDLAGPVKQVISKATAEDPAVRYATAAELGADLTGLLDNGLPRTQLPPRDTAPNPYKGLRPFGEADAADFAGRDALVNRLVSRLAEEGTAGRFLAVVGPSGSGKSSVVRAGLVPALRRGAVAGSSAWFVTTMQPGATPSAALEAALLRVAVAPSADLAVERILGEGALTKAIRRALPDESVEVLLVVDQLEEVFTLCEDEDERTGFLASLAGAVGDPSSRIRLVTTLRADFYDRPLEHPAFAVLMRARTETVVPMAPDEIQRAICVPAARVGVTVEPDVVGRIVADVAGRPGSLPLLQYALTELFDRRRNDTFTLEAYEAIGGVAGALAGRAEHTYDLLSAPAQAAARQLFLRLVTLGEGDADTRRRALVSELLTVGSQPEAMQEAIDAFGASRLLSFDRDAATRLAQAEIAHEALLGAWHRLRGWVEVARHDVRLLGRLSSAAADWADADADPSFLLRGGRLDQFEAWARTEAVQLSGIEASFLQASIDERQREAAAEEELREHDAALERRAVNRLRALVAVLTVAALLAGGLTVVAVAQTRRATRQVHVATARGLAAASTANLESDPERSILLALEAIAATRDADGTVLPEAEEALHRAVMTSRAVLQVADIGGALAWSPAGDLFVTEGPEDTGIVDLRDADTGESVRAFHGHDIDVNQVAFNHDGGVLATVGDDGAARAWDPETGKPLWAVEREGEVLGASFSADGSAFAAAWPEEGVVRVVDTATGDVRTEIGSLELARATSFSIDGSSLAVAYRASGDQPAPMVWDLSTGQADPTLPYPEEPLFDVKYSPDGRWLATNTVDGTIGVYDADSGDLRSTVPAGSGMAWSPDATRLVVGHPDGGVHVWDVSPEGITRQLLSLSSQAITSAYGVTFSPDGDRVMAGDLTISAVQVWDVTMSATAEWAVLPGHPDVPNAAVFAPDGRRLIASRDAGIPDAPHIGEVSIWDLESGDEIVKTADRRNDTVYRMEMSADGGLLATAAGFDEQVVVLDGETADEVFTVRAEAEIAAIAWDGAGELLAVSSWDGAVTIVDRAGKEVAALEAGDDLAVGSMSFSADGRHLALAIFDAGRRPQPSVRGARIWDWRRDEMVGWIPTHLEGVRYDPTGALLATQHVSGDIHLWDAATYELSATLQGHRGIVWALDFNPDGTRLASGGADATVRLWDVPAAGPLLTLPAHTSHVTDVRFSPDGSRLASAAEDGTIRVWALDLDDLIRIARGKLTRGLTDDECRRYLQQPRCA